MRLTNLMQTHAPNFETTACSENDTYIRLDPIKKDPDIYGKLYGIDMQTGTPEILNGKQSCGINFLLYNSWYDDPDSSDSYHSKIIEINLDEKHEFLNKYANEFKAFFQNSYNEDYKKIEVIYIDEDIKVIENEK